MTRVVGTAVAHTNTGYPYAGGLRREFDLSEIATIGRLVAYGDAATRCIVQLHDGAQLIVIISKQEASVRRLLGKSFRELPGPYRCGDRSVGWLIAAAPFRPPSECWVADTAGSSDARG